MCRLLVCLAIVSLLACRTHSAAVLEDHSAAWAAAGLDTKLAAGHEFALPESLFEALVAAAPRVSRETSEPGVERYRFGKRNTWWLPLKDARGLRPAPRSVIEAAVHRLYDLDFGSSATPIIGAEWWFQEQGPAEGISYHYDKDEAYASEHMTMRFPEVSTVTYLTDIGAPTVLLNQTTPDGNLEVPQLPQQALVVHPQRNKHLVFRGNLNHGVSGELSRWAKGGEMHASLASRSGNSEGPRRRTLLINWWRSQPMPPNTVVFDLQRWQRMQLLLTSSAAQALLRAEGERAPERLIWEPMWPQPLSKPEMKALPRVAIELPPTELYHFAFPSPAQLREGNFAVEWRRGMAIGPIARLDLHNERSLSTLFRETRPKLFLVLHSRGGSKRKWTDRSLPGWVRPLHERYEHALKFVLAEPNEAPDFLRQFGLTRRDAPTMVIHDTRRGDLKFRLHEPFGKESAFKFVQDFLEGRLLKEELR